VRDRLVARAYAIAWALVRRVPLRVAELLFTVGADIAWRRDGRAVRRLRVNLRQVLGVDDKAVDRAVDDLNRLTRRGLRSYARYWMEAFRLPAMSPEQVNDAFVVGGMEHLQAALATGRGAVVALPHMGNWDLAGAWIVLQDVPFTTVVERLNPAALFDEFVAYRESLGMEVLPLTGGAAPPIDVLAERLRAGRLVCLVGDRDLSRQGIEVRLHGSRTRLPAGPALLALRTGAALLPVTLWYDGRRHATGQIHPPVTIPDAPRLEQVAAMTQAVAGVFEAAEVEHPEDWHMLQRYFLDGSAAVPSAQTTARAQR